MPGSVTKAWFTIWFGKPRTLEFRKAHPCEMSWWIQTHIQESIAAHYKGWCKDEGVPERWRGEPEKYQTFRAYFDMLNSHAPRPLRAVLWSFAKKSYPKELLCEKSASSPARA